MSVGLHPLQDVARALGDRARAILVGWAMLAAAGLIASVGCGFVVFAGYMALRHVVGPVFAALLVAFVLLGLAALLARLSRGPGVGVRPGKPIDPLPGVPAPAPLSSADPATMAVFTAAFVLGRRLAGRRT